MNLPPTALEAKLRSSWPSSDWADLNVLVAVSGGADSVGLLRVLLATREQGKGRLAVAHFNHRLRGSAADEDAEFVAALSERLGVEFHLGRCRRAGSIEATASGLEEQARDERYAFLQNVAEQIGARFVVTAHTANDQAETILHRILRGTGLAGLAGMPRTRPLGPAVTLIRPLLEIEGDEIVQYLDALGQPFRIDESNQDTRFTRNRLRQELLPSLQSDYNPEVQGALLRLGGLASEAQQVIDDRVAELLDASVNYDDPSGVRIDCRPLGQASRFLICELLVAIWRRQNWPRQAMGHAQWSRLASMTCAETNGLDIEQAHFPGEILVRREGHDLILTVPLT